MKKLVQTRENLALKHYNNRVQSTGIRYAAAADEMDWNACHESAANTVEIKQ